MISTIETTSTPSLPTKTAENCFKRLPSLPAAQLGHEMSFASSSPGKLNESKRLIVWIYTCKYIYIYISFYLISISITYFSHTDHIWILYPPYLWNHTWYIYISESKMSFAWLSDLCVLSMNCTCHFSPLGHFANWDIFQTQIALDRWISQEVA